MFIPGNIPNILANILAVSKRSVHKKIQPLPTEYLMAFCLLINKSQFIIAYTRQSILVNVVGLRSFMLSLIQGGENSKNFENVYEVKQ
ncbi:CIC11C00000003858 [Sungouiella intermedia]|uniref:CIC11C00000003858 n=1 Tax=Sungouiella intermedia TaxID=45354 RepID=A0A1L0BQA3_9ASCO|nr:CIC11C00000003858 [[Candida] intermedia]